jgi:hypothetical protein
VKIEFAVAPRGRNKQTDPRALGRQLKAINVTPVLSLTLDRTARKSARSLRQQKSVEPGSTGKKDVSLSGPPPPPRARDSHSISHFQLIPQGGRVWTDLQLGISVITAAISNRTAAAAAATSFRLDSDIYCARRMLMATRCVCGPSFDQYQQISC